MKSSSVNSSSSKKSTGLNRMADVRLRQGGFERKRQNQHTKNNVLGNSKTRCNWSQRAMQCAFNAVKFSGATVKIASNMYNVPESTLRDRIHGRVGMEVRRNGPPTFFTHEEEKKIVNHVLYMSKLGYPYQRNQVIELAADMMRSTKRISVKCKGAQPSQTWFYAFTNRWGDVRNHIHGQRANNRRTKGISAESLNCYFEQLDRIITNYNIKDIPERFWTMDDLSITFDSGPPRIVPVAHQRVQQSTFTSPNISVISCGSATGEKLPPFLAHRSAVLDERMLQNCTVGAKVCVSPNGWINCDLFLVWMLHHFVPAIADIERPVMLFYDAHIHYVTLRVLERATFEGIIMFPLPPHPAYVHCVENTCFWAFEHYFTRAVNLFTRLNPTVTCMNKFLIGPLVCHAEKYALQEKNFSHLFLKVGICPFNNIAATVGAYYGGAAALIGGSGCRDANTSQAGGHQQNGGTTITMKDLSQHMRLKIDNNVNCVQIGEKTFVAPVLETASSKLFANNTTALSNVSPIGSSIHHNKDLLNFQAGKSYSDQSSSSKHNEYIVLESSNLNAEQICYVCGNQEPPPSSSSANSGVDEECGDKLAKVVDWAFCNYCNRHLHVNTCVDITKCYYEDTFFACALCCQEEHQQLQQQFVEEDGGTILVAGSSDDCGRVAQQTPLTIRKPSMSSKIIVLAKTPSFP